MLKESIKNEVLKNIKESKHKREEYNTLILSLLEVFKKEEETNPITGFDKMTFQLSFRYFYDKIMRTNNISFGFLTLTRHHIKSNKDRVLKDDEKYIKEFNHDFDFLIEYLIEQNKIDNFIEFLKKKAIPNFINNQYISNICIDYEL